MTYRKLIVLGAAVLLLAGALPARAMDLKAEQLLEKVQKVYAGAVGFRAEYSLFFEGGTLASTKRPSEIKRAEGIMLYGSPDRLRLIQETPLEEEMVISPKGIWWYLREDNEAHRYPASDFYALFSPLMGFFKVMGNFKELENSFTITRHYGEDKGKEQAIKMVPHTHKTGLDRLVIWVNEKNRISRVAVHIINGDTSTYTFNTMEILSEDPEEGFGFTPPAGAKIVHH